MVENMRDILNSVYEPIVDKSKELMTALTELKSGFKATIGFFNGHYHKTSEGRYRMDAYPIAVISIMGLCDIEIDFDAISITTKLSKEQAQFFDWKSLEDASFEVYGVDDCLLDYGSNQDLDELCERILQSAEKEFFITFYLPVMASTGDIIEMIKMVTINEFFY